MKLQPHEYKVESEGDNGWSVTVTHLATGISRKVGTYRNAKENKEVALAYIEIALDNLRRKADSKEQVFLVELTKSEVETLADMIAIANYEAVFKVKPWGWTYDLGLALGVAQKIEPLWNEDFEEDE